MVAVGQLLCLGIKFIGRLNTSSLSFHAYYIGRGGEEGGQGGVHDRPEGRAKAGLKAIMYPAKADCCRLGGLSEMKSGLPRGVTAV